MGVEFLKPEKPFLLIFTDTLGADNIEWFDDEKDFKDRIREIKMKSYVNIDAIEIGSCRDINVDEI